MQKGTDTQGRSTLLSNTGKDHMGVGVYERVLPVVAALLVAMPPFDQEAGTHGCNLRVPVARFLAK